MSVALTSEPFMFSWAKNRNNYVLTCNSLDSAGSAARYTFAFSGTRPAAGTHIVIAVDGAEYIFTFGRNSGAYDIRTVAEIGYKMANCWYLQQLFSTSSNAQNDVNNFFLSLTGLSVGAHQVEIYTTDANGKRDGGEDSLVSTSLSSTGTDKSSKENYSIAVIIEAVVNNNNTTTTNKGRFVFQPNDAGIVEVPLDIVGSLIPQPDIPSTTATGWSLLTNAIVKYRIIYGEMYGEVPQVQSMTTGGWKYAICGEVADRFARLNLPDWNSGSALQIVNTQNVLWVLGEDTGKTVRTESSKPEYLYAFWYNSGTEVNETRTVTMQIYTLNSSGEEVLTSTVSHTVKNGNVYRIAVGASQLNLTGGYYRIVLSGAVGTWTRTYLVEDDTADAVTMLLQNKYGVLQCFRMTECKREVTRSSEELVIGKRRYLGLTDGYEQYKVKSTLLNKDEANRIASCICQPYHYIMNDTAWLRISIEDGSYTVRDDENGMVSIEFTFRFVENQQENMTNGSLSVSISNTSADDLDTIVTFSDITTPNSNRLL